MHFRIYTITYDNNKEFRFCGSQKGIIFSATISRIKIHKLVSIPPTKNQQILQTYHRTWIYIRMSSNKSWPVRRSYTIFVAKKDIIYHDEKLKFHLIQ